MLQQLTEEDVQKVSREVAKITAISGGAGRERPRRVPPHVRRPATTWPAAASTTRASCCMRAFDPGSRPSGCSTG